MAFIPTDPSRRPRVRTGPLAGIRVTDFCWMGVGAIATRILAEFGAEVIRIEDRNRLDMPRRLPIYKDGEIKSYGNEDPDPDPNKGGMFNNYNRNKLGITLNMRTAKGKAIAEKLISVSDVVTENFAPGVMERWGLDEAAVRAIKSDVIYARMCGFGHTGPQADYRSYGPVVQAACGLSHIAGLPGMEPSGWGLSYMDNQAAYYNAAAVLMAIYARNETGQGTDIDISAVEAGVELVGPLLLDVGVNGRSTRGGDFPIGNRLDQPKAAPHGVYPCRGDDRWVAIAAIDESEWQGLVQAMGSPAWTAEPRFASAAARWDAQLELDRLVGEWTRDRDRYEVMHDLQARGVAASAVQDARDVNETDPQMAHRNVFIEMDHPVIGVARFEGSPFESTSFAPDNWRSAPLLGEDNHYVLREILGLDEGEISMLEKEDVL